MKKVPVSLYAEMTPNPSVMKFVANKRLVTVDSVEFKNIEEAKPSPLATKLFHYPFVKEIFITANYVSITKYDIVEWEDVTMELREMIREFLASGGITLNPEMLTPKRDNPSEDTSVKPVINQKHELETPEEEWDIIDEKIVSLLEEYVKPAVESDGGNIKFLNHKEGVVSVLLQGACSGCPSSTATLKGGIEQMLNTMLPGQIKEVVAVNG